MTLYCVRPTVLTPCLGQSNANSLDLDGYMRHLAQIILSQKEEFTSFPPILRVSSEPIGQERVIKIVAIEQHWHDSIAEQTVQCNRFDFVPACSHQSRIPFVIMMIKSAASVNQFHCNGFDFIPACAHLYPY